MLEEKGGQGPGVRKPLELSQAEGNWKPILVSNLKKEGGGEPDPKKVTFGESYKGRKAHNLFKKKRKWPEAQAGLCSEPLMSCSQGLADGAWGRRGEPGLG